MSILRKPVNDWAKSLWVLNQQFTAGVSMAVVLRDYDMFFYKFQSRIGEVEKEYPALNLEKETRTYTSKITGKTKHYTHYTPRCSQSYLYKLYNEINAPNGFKGKTNKPEQL